MSAEYIVTEEGVFSSRGLKVSVLCVCPFCSSTAQYITTGMWNYTLTMTAYTNAKRTNAVDSNTILHLNQRVWFEIKADLLDDNLVALVTDSCFATNQPSADSNLKYNLIING